MTTIVSTTAQFDLSEIFSNAWAIVRQEAINFSEALKAAWAKAKAVLASLNVDEEKLNELSIAELTALRDAVDALILQKQQPEEVEYSHELKFEIEDDKCYTTSYYNEEFITKARGLQGKWTSGRWAFPVAIAEHVKKAMLACYGVTGEHPYPVCVVEVRNFSDSAHTSGVELFGRPICKAYGRDSGAKPQDHIILLDGRFRSSGSMKNWYSEAKNATFEIHKFPMARTEFDDVQKAISEGWAAIK